MAPQSFPSRIVHALLLLIALSVRRQAVIVAEALSTGARSNTQRISSGSSLQQRLEQIQCGLQVSVGRIPGTAMPPEWAASGAKLGFPLEIEFCEDPCDDFDMNKERLLSGPGRSSSKSNNFKAVVPLNEPSFISNNGQEEILVEEGAYGVEVQYLEAQQYKLRFFLDFPKGAVRNDCSLPAERIYFLTSCWIQNEASLARAQQRVKATEQILLETVHELKELQASSNNILQKAMGVRQSVVLVEKKQKLERQLDELKQTYPLQPELLIEGPNGITFVKEGIIAVKRFRGTMDTREQYHWVGTFAMKEFYEEEDDDEE